MTALTEEYVDLKTAIYKLRKKLDRLLKKEEAIRDEIEELYKFCTHEEIDKKDSYYSGNYDERASTTYGNQCTLCGLKSNSKTVTHSYYG